MMGVDEPRQHHVLGGIAYVEAWRRRAASRGHQFDDAAALHHDAALRAVRQDREGILDPERRFFRPHSITTPCRDIGSSYAAVGETGVPSCRDRLSSSTA